MLFAKIAMAALFAFMIWRMLPIASEWMKNGPKGSSSDWFSTALLLGGVVVFVIFLTSLV